MKLIAGLGNPGAEYANTKHNVGFMLIDALAEHLNASAWKEDFSSSVAEARIGGEKIFLVKPLTYMNNSGEAIGPMLSYYKLSSEDLIVVHDDMDIPVGTVRIRKKGSSGGHNGIKSILSHVDSEAFARVRIGIGRPPTGWTVIISAPVTEFMGIVRSLRITMIGLGILILLLAVVINYKSSHSVNTLF